MKIIKRAIFQKSWNQSFEQAKKAMARGDLDAAKALVRQLRGARKMFTKSDPRLAEAYKWAARWYHAGDDPQGSKLDRENHRRLSKAHGPHHPQTQEALFDLVGNDVYSPPDPALVKEAVVGAANLDRLDPRRLLIRGKMAYLSFLDGATEEAARVLQDVAKDWEVRFSKRVDSTQPDRTGYLAELCFELGLSETALALFRQQQRYLETTFGSHHATLAPNLHRQGQIHLIRGRADTAVKYLEKALFFEDHPELRASLGGAYHAAGRLDKAAGCYSDYLHHARAEFGAKDSKTVRALHCLLSVHYASGSLETAAVVREELEKASRRPSKEMGRELASKHRLLGGLAPSRELALCHLEKAVDLSQRYWGKKHVLTALARRDLAAKLESGRRARSLAKAADKRLLKAREAERQMADREERRHQQHLKLLSRSKAVA